MTQGKIIMKITIEKNNKQKSKTKKDKPNKKKSEFAQKWLIGCIIISVVFTSMSYILAWFDKNTVENLQSDMENIKKAVKIYLTELKYELL